MVLRDEILEFACAMEEKMAIHDKERGDEWKEFMVHYLVRRLANEYHEFLSSLATPKPDFDKVREELVDTANLCMMLYNRFDNGGNQQ